jgi:hypothetical protein
MNPVDMVRVELFRNTVLLGVCIVVSAVLAVRLAKGDRSISGTRAIGLASLPILIQIVREMVRSNSWLDFFLPVFVAVALGYSLVALIRCPARTCAAIAVTFAFLEVLLIPGVMVPQLTELFSGF